MPSTLEELKSLLSLSVTDGAKAVLQQAIDAEQQKIKNEASAAIADMHEHVQTLDETTKTRWESFVSRIEKLLHI